MKQKLLLMALLAASWTMQSQWATQNTGFTAASRGLDEIHIVDANTVWAKGYDGSATGANVQIFTKTTNGGTTWTTGTINVGSATLEITNLMPINATTAWAGAVHPTNGLGGVWKTTNGGTSWTKQNTGAYSTIGSSFFNVVHFFDENNGVTEGDPVAGEFEVYTTSNGGTTWTAVPAASLPNPESDEYGYNGGNVAAGNSFWFVTNKGKLYRTTDMGATWTKLDTPITDFSATAVGGQIFFSDNNNGILLARSTTGSGSSAVNTYTLYKTSNGGTSWDSGASYTSNYTNLNYIKGTNVLVGTGTDGDNFFTGYSNNNGTSWTQIDSGVQRVSIAFLNGTTGWASGFTTGATPTEGIYKYTGSALGIEDIASGKTFKAYPNPANNQLNLSGASINEVAIYDLLGKQILNQKFSSQDQVSLNVSGLETGMYVLTATNDSGAKETIKFAKQ
ncbi:T9SS type A sorting domain-containing protein [Flavobacterium microcysteis]|uniref:T9SS type A sorting domain-containing protein n=1 Tax=Flavobacterium microcysteis TaxID=2596891 RepID=A0A501PZF4_9FLAO|nr:T9SS type A sorting domain-containing protein [Flavobacterium microcysteis]TPD65558.1 T9SS type A sorting domain-containing protein [Flavobacterium microcysteis]